MCIVLLPPGDNPIAVNKYISYTEIKCQLDATNVFFVFLIACSTCFGHHYAQHQELESIIQLVAACGLWCCKDGKCNFVD
jgi:hypothetical protein